MEGAIERPTEGDLATMRSLDWAFYWKQCKFAADLNFKSSITLLKLAIRT